MALWPEWVVQLDDPTSPLSLQTPLVQLASSDEEAERMRQLAEARPHAGLRFLDEHTLTPAAHPWPRPGHGALLSERDGRVDPLGLLNRARQEQETFDAVLNRFGRERLLYRIGISEYRDRFLLKGAMLFSLWYDMPHRPTRDMDLLGFGHVSQH